MNLSTKLPARQIGTFTIALAFAANEVRGFILAAPILWAMWTHGGEAMKLWLGFCTIAGVALSVLVPRWIALRFMTGRTPQSAG
jgi:NADH:ubiquinone oxidoreductase subunit 5 (subunit L)/multisubunit Na+/H+ antiporter MnhA subunit